MRRVVLFLCLSFGLLSVGFTQVPGILGRRFVIEANCHFMPLADFLEFNHSNYSGSAGGIGKPGFTLNTVYGLSGEWIASRRFSLRVSGIHFRTGDVEGTVPGVGVEMNTFLGFGGSLGFRFYPFARRGILPPIGTYTEFTLYSNFLEERFRIVGEDVMEPGYGILEQRLSYAIGRNWILNERLLLGAGFRLTTPFLSFRQSSPGGRYELSYSLRLNQFWAFLAYGSVGVLL